MKKIALFIATVSLGVLGFVGVSAMNKAQSSPQQKSMFSRFKGAISGKASELKEAVKEVVVDPKDLLRQKFEESESKLSFASIVVDEVVDSIIKLGVFDNVMLDGPGGFKGLLRTDVQSFVSTQLIPNLITFLENRGLFKGELVVGGTSAFVPKEKVGVVQKMQAKASHFLARLKSKAERSRPRIFTAINQAGYRLGDIFLDEVKAFMSREFKDVADEDINKFGSLFLDEVEREIKEFATSESLKMTNFLKK